MNIITLYSWQNYKLMYIHCRNCAMLSGRCWMFPLCVVPPTVHVIYHVLQDCSISHIHVKKTQVMQQIHTWSWGYDILTVNTYKIWCHLYRHMWKQYMMMHNTINVIHDVLQWLCVSSKSMLEYTLQFIKCTVVTDNLLTDMSKYFCTCHNLCTAPTSWWVK